MDAISSYRSNRPTKPQANKQTGPITIHCTAKLSAECNKVDVHIRATHEISNISD